VRVARTYRHRVGGKGTRLIGILLAVEIESQAVIDRYPYFAIGITTAGQLRDSAAIDHNTMFLEWANQEVWPFFWRLRKLRHVIHASLAYSFAALLPGSELRLGLGARGFGGGLGLAGEGF
jgi:hypothetical protein